jgi:hypothetical protein
MGFNSADPAEKHPKGGVMRRPRYPEIKACLAGLYCRPSAKVPPNREFAAHLLVELEARRVLAEEYDPRLRPLIYQCLMRRYQMRPTVEVREAFERLRALQQRDPGFQQRAEYDAIRESFPSLFDELYDEVSSMLDTEEKIKIGGVTYSLGERAHRRESYETLRRELEHSGFLPADETERVRKVKEWRRQWKREFEEERRANSMAHSPNTTPCHAVPTETDPACSWAAPHPLEPAGHS